MIDPNHLPSNSNYRQGCRCTECKRCHAADRRARRALTVELGALIGPQLGPWRYESACRQVDDDTRKKFLSNNNADINHAIRICQTCPVKTECLEYALEARALYVWGGTSGKQRSAIQRQRLTQKVKAPK